MKKYYANENKKKHDLIREVRRLKKGGTLAEMSKETIARLIAMI